MLNLHMGRQYIIPLGITADSAANPFLGIRPGFGRRVRLLGMKHNQADAAGETITIKKVDGNLAGTLLSNVVDPSDYAAVAPEFIAHRNISAVGTVSQTGPGLWSPPNTATPAWEVEPFFYEIGQRQGWTVQFSGGVEPVNAGAQITLTANGTAHIFQAGSGTDTATLHFFTVGATYLTAAAAFVAAVNAVFSSGGGQRSATVVTDTVTIPRAMGLGQDITAIVDTTDVGTDITVTALTPYWLTFTSTSAAKKIDGYLVVWEYPEHSIR